MPTTTTTTGNMVDAHLEMDPADAIVFTLRPDEATPRVTLTLRHPDPTSPPIAFKVKTTQPRRYLVRPNQGMIAPGSSEIVQILLVEKDKQQLWTSYLSLGMIGLEHCKDKFLVQSVAIPNAEEATALQSYDSLTTFWSSSPTAVVNKKLHVRHTVVDDASAGTSPNAATPLTKNNSTPTTTASALMKAPSEMNKEQLVPELTNLRRKYDELVAFSVNLTAERDMLSNTLEQTKRDLQRAVSSSNRNTNNNSANTSGRSGALATTKKSSTLRNVLGMLFMAILWIVVGVQLQPYLQPHQDNLINYHIPTWLDHVNQLLVSGGGTTSSSSASASASAYKKEEL